MIELAGAAEFVGRIEAHYQAVALGPMADMPLCNPRLSVRLVQMVAWEGGYLGVLVMPWAINLLRLPGASAWPQAAPLAKQVLRFPSGDYVFVHGNDVGFGPYQVCSLFSPALEFDSMEAACATAVAALLALLRVPMAVPEVPQAAEPVSRRRWLFGRGDARRTDGHLR